MAIITHRWSKGPLGAGAVISSTASTQRLESRDCIVIAVGGRKLSRGTGFGPGRTGKALAEDLLFQPDRRNVAVRDEGGAGWKRGQVP